MIGILIALAISVGTNDDDWEELAEDTLESRGHDVDRIVTCNAIRNGDTALVSGTFYENSKLKNFHITYVNDGGRWVVSNFVCLRSP